MLRTLLMAAALTVAAGAAAAQTDAECRTAMREAMPQTTMNICADREAAEVQDRLDALLDRLRTGLEPVRWKALVRVQRRWQAYRREQCEFEGAAYQGGSGQPFVRALCWIELGENRIRELKRTAAEAGR